MFLKSFVLSIRLFFDRRVPVMLKLLPLGTLLYVLSPIDLLPDVIPVVGIVDDFAILFFLLNIFVQNAPEHVLKEHAAKLSEDDRLMQIIRGLGIPVDVPLSGNLKKRKQDNVIDGEVIK